jgi:hypothetical protein
MAQSRPGSSFSPGFGRSSIRRAQAIPGLPGHAQGLRTKEMRAKWQGKFSRVWWPRLVGERGWSSSSSHCLPRAVKACRRRTCSHAARLVNARPPIHRGLPRVWPAAFTSFSPIHSSPSPDEQWWATAPMTVRPTMASAGAPCTSGRAACSTWGATRRRPTSARPEAGA